MSDDILSWHLDDTGKPYRSKHEIPASELMTAFYQDMVGISQGLAEQLDTANERIAALEAALRALVDEQGWVFPNGSGVDKCAYCEQVQTYSLEKSRYAPENHAPDCPVVIARTLLDEQKP